MTVRRPIVLKNGTLKELPIGDTVAGAEGARPLFVQDTPPSSPNAGDEWLDTTTGITYTFVDDGNTQQWVELGPGGGPSTAPVFYEQSSPPSAPNPGDRWLDATTGDIYTYVDDGTSAQWVELPG
jgi:hypothetical protein